MLKPYRNEFTDKLNYTTQMHPSTWLFAWFTKNIDVAIVTTGFCLSLLCVFNGFAATMFTVWLALVGVIWFIYLLTVAVRSFKILKKNYNEYLLPIEVAFNGMADKDQRRYSSILNQAYAICARRNYDEFPKLVEIQELFEISASLDKKIVSLETELKNKRKAAQERAAFDRMQDEILNEFKKEHGI